MLHLPRSIAQPRRRRPAGTVLFQGFPFGLNTSVPMFQLTQKEMAECVDWKINRGGQLETRGAIVKKTTVAATGQIKACESAIIDGTQQTIIGDSGNKVYYLDGTEITLIGTAEGEPYFIPYNDVCLVCDGSHLKFLDGVSALKIAYDAGESGTQFNNYSGTDDSGIAISNGTNNRAAVKFTSDSWASGFTIPITQVSAFLKRTGSPTGTITFKLRKVSDDSVLASKDLSQTAGQISTSGEFVDVYFSASDVTTEMSPDTEYYATVEHSGGDGSNYVSLQCSTNGNFTNTGYHYTTSWVNDTGKNPIMKVYPGLPPKGSFGWVSKLRPWLAGDPDNPGYVWYGNLTHLDFSTSAGGGYIGVIDQDKNSFPVGGGQDLYGEMFVYGQETQPYISRLEGSGPSDFKLPLMFQRAWATQKTLKNVGNDLWNASSSGVDALSGVQQYGDVRTFSASDKVKDRFEKYWNTSATFAGYYPEDGQYWLCFDHANYQKILVGHTKQPYADITGQGFPWTEYTLPCTATHFGTSADGFAIGGDDGHLYGFDKDEYKDLGTDHILPSFRTAYMELPFNTIDLTNIQSMVSSVGGSTMTISIFKDGNTFDSWHDYEFSIPMSDALTVDDLTFDIDDWVGALDASYSPMYFNININARSFQIQYRDVYIVGHPVFFNGCVLKYRRLEDS